MTDEPVEREETVEAVSDSECNEVFMEDPPVLSDLVLNKEEIEFADDILKELGLLESREPAKSPVLDTDLHYLGTVSLISNDDDPMNDVAYNCEYMFHG